ncbi:MAG: hypothetical protein IJS15_05750, partial [Victivallales bacterium]|nr:hypothetical protein [Victivallales bacterium]
MEPRYRNPDVGDYTLRPGSPMIDAGAAEFATELDYFGVERVDDTQMADTGSADENGVCPDLGFAEMVGGVAEGDIDLVVNWVRGPAVATVGDEVEVRWQTVNSGTATAYGPWTDVVSVAAGESSLGGQVVELGETVCTGNLQPNGFHEYSARFRLPPMSEGLWRFQVAVNQFREVREGRNEENNIALADWTFRVSLPIMNAGESELELEAGETASYRLANLTKSGGLLVFRSVGQVVVGGNAGFVAADGKTLWKAQKISDGVWSLNIPANQTGAVYVQVENQGGEATVVEVSYDNSAFSIFAGDVREVPNQGNVTLTLCGTRLSADMELWLQNGSRKISAEQLIQGGDGLFWATFALDGIPAGDYAIWAKLPDTGETASAPALNVRNNGIGPKWWCRLSGASTARTSRQSVLTFEYGNSGDAELPAPYVRFYNGGGATLRFSPDEDWQEERELLAISNSYPYSVLKPGESRSVTVYFTIPSNVNNASINYTYTLDDDSPYPWESNAANMRPDWADDEAWGHILASLKANIGETWNDYLDTMRRDLNQLGALGYVGCRLDQLWQMEVNAALGADGGISALAAATDLARSGRGMGIAFSRSYSAQLFRRMRSGVLGRGWTFSYDYSCKMDSGAAMFEISYPGGSTRTFTKTGKNWYAKQPDDRGTMSVNGSEVTITERSGNYTVYDTAIGRPIRSGDLEGNSITLEWQDDMLQSVTHSDGQKLTLAYQFGLIASVSDDHGRTTHYSYADGNLVAVTSFNGLTTRYNYNPFSHTPNSRALVQVEYSDGTTQDYAYDTWGRVATASVNGTEQTIEVCRDAIGVFRVIDADGAEATSYSGPYGETLLAVDPLGGQTRMSYDQDTRQMLSIQTPEGKKISMQYDADQNVNRLLNPAGFATEFTHTPAFGSLRSFTDANGQSVKYTHDKFDRQTAITYQDGSSEHWTYDERGDAVAWTNRRGQTVSCEYDGEGRLIEKRWSDGRVFSYTYNILGNLTKVSDTVTGDITVEYDSHEWVTRVTYPQNRWFAFTRDAIGRVVKRTAFDGHVLCTEYDELGRAYRWTDGAGDLYRQNIYDDTVGRLVRANHGNGTYTTYAYDMAGRVTAIEHHQPNGTVFAFFRYTYNADGQRVAMTTKDGVHRYAYDAAGQLLAATYPDGSSDEFAFDPVGNRIAANGVAYAKNSLNQYTRAGDDSFEYDADGNLTAWTTAEGVTRYEYDILNRLVRVVRPDASEWSCVYDAVGNRISVTDGGKTRETLYLGGVYADFEDGVETRYLGSIVERGDTTRYWHADGLSSVRAITDANGALVGTQDYGVAGNLVASTGETTEFGFVGLGDVRLDSTRLLFMKNRYYSPTLGRFIQSDPIGIEAGDVNYMRYCYNDSVNFIDENGMSAGEIGHLILDMCGFIDVWGIGTAADLANASWYAAEGAAADAALSSTAAAPLVGDVAGAAKMAKWGKKAANLINKGKKGKNVAKDSLKVGTDVKGGLGKGSKQGGSHTPQQPTAEPPPSGKNVDESIFKDENVDPNRGTPPQGVGKILDIDG